MTLEIAPAQAFAHFDPAFFDSLSDADFLSVFGADDDFWLRPAQHITRADWRYFGFLCGRGFGKTLGIGIEINRRVECGEAKCIALMAPTEDRVDEVQIQTLIDTAPPWFKPERYYGGLLWPNGARAYVFSPEAPGRPRSGNFDLAWLTEIVDWQHNTRKEAFDNITTATRIGRAQVLWDTTSRGKNDVILHLLELHDQDAQSYPLVRGEIFDNPTLGAKYLRAECKKYTGRRKEEELKGAVYAEAEGALWHQDWIDDYRRPMAPTPIALRLVAIDPAISMLPGADETGLVIGCSDLAGDAYVERDESAKMPPEEWCEIAVKECAENDAAGIVIERNRGGDVNIALIRVHAAKRGMVLVMLGKDDHFPRRAPGKIYVKEMWAATSKQARAAAPAAYGKLGRVHHLKKFEKLELQLTTWEPGTTESPNALDAHSYLIAELAGLNDEVPATAPAEAVRAAIQASRDLNKQIAALPAPRVGM